MKTPPDDYRAAYIFWKQLSVEDRKLKRVARELGIVLPKSPDKAVAILNRLSRQIRRWEKRGFVRHSVLRAKSEAANRPERVPDLEQELRQRFPLRHVVVCDVSRIAESDPYRRDDEVHQSLGKWGGRILNVCLRGDSEVVGTGGGRGPYYSALACQFNDRVDYPRKVISLTGRINAKDWAPEATSYLDADRVAAELAGNLRIREVLQAGSDIAARTKGPAIPCEQVTFALIGVGALAGGHRLLNYKEYQELAPIREELSRLSELIQQIEGRPKKSTDQPVNHWVGDLCNRLFVCEPPGAPRATRKAKHELMELVERLNEKLLSPKLNDIRDICRRGAVMAVCGGRHKAMPIWHLLKQGEPVVSHLIVDKPCCEQILSIENSSNARDRQSSTE